MAADGTSVAQKRPLWFGVGGINGGLFNPPDWIDKAKPPGYTSQVELLGLRRTLRNVYTLEYFLWSPNLVWFAIALAYWKFFPYDIEAFKDGFPFGYCLKRFIVNEIACGSYYGFFFVTLYLLKWSKRKYEADKIEPMPTVANMVHDLWYWNLGVLQWTAWECVMMRLWATGRAPYSTNEEVFSSPYLFALNLLWVLLIPIWRDFHFYFAHRFSHIYFFYKYVHKLHHRNYNTEPFSGMCMHPVEHLVYFSNVWIPSLFLQLSPLIFLWNFVHLTFAPGAGHSGWEDHFQADQYHYLHHCKFECNYGSPFSAFIDQFMGTFREKLGDSDAYKGEWKEQSESLLNVQELAAAKRPFASQSYLALAQGSHLVYTIFYAALFAVASWGVFVNPLAETPVRSLGPVPMGVALATLVAYGPIVFAFFLNLTTNDTMNWRFPFQKETGVFMFFNVAAWVSVIYPIYAAVLRAGSP